MLHGTRSSGGWREGVAVAVGAHIPTGGRHPSGGWRWRWREGAMRDVGDGVGGYSSSGGGSGGGRSGTRNDLSVLFARADARRGGGIARALLDPRDAAGRAGAVGRGGGLSLGERGILRAGGRRGGGHLASWLSAPACRCTPRPRRLPASHPAPHLAPRAPAPCVRIVGAVQSGPTRESRESGVDTQDAGLRTTADLHHRPMSPPRPPHLQPTRDAVPHNAGREGKGRVVGGRAGDAQIGAVGVQGERLLRAVSHRVSGRVGFALFALEFRVGSGCVELRRGGLARERAPNSSLRQNEERRDETRRFAGKIKTKDEDQDEALIGSRFLCKAALRVEYSAGIAFCHTELDCPPDEAFIVDSPSHPSDLLPAPAPPTTLHKSQIQNNGASRGQCFFASALFDGWG
ncbi:hypothetical protein C8F04DRAFT_1184512 [Mycena alexandri]|uniref:Uncharacterized protein n=1 Tax=Mycena alexandri TaxID=1745969 RepID=A0AAD6X5N1_9AGAR|nr:hypothetical protein C8F04DRAFT_1184512 [Mycena alexandri]